MCLCCLSVSLLCLSRYYFVSLCELFYSFSFHLMFYVFLCLSFFSSFVFLHHHQPNSSSCLCLSVLSHFFLLVCLRTVASCSLLCLLLTSILHHIPTLPPHTYFSSISPLISPISLLLPYQKYTSIILQNTHFIITTYTTQLIP